MRILLFISASLLFLTSCEKVISIDVPEGQQQLVVDGFLTNETGAQKIKLTVSQPYFDNSSLTGAMGASVKVISSAGDTFLFNENNIGEYIWTPKGNDTLCKVGLAYSLQINYKGSIYQAYTTMHPVPVIDSLKFSKGEAFGPPSKKDGYSAEFFARDFPKEDDYYWIKYYHNDTLFSDASSLLLSVNGAVYPPGADGFEFIIPVRKAINKRSSQYHLGDSVKVEILSITHDTWQFFSEAKTQMTNGGLFATPPANIPTNISKSTGDGILAIGWFSTSALSRRTETVK